MHRRIDEWLRSKGRRQISKHKNMYIVIYWRNEEGNERIVYPVLEDWGAIKCFYDLTGADKCAEDMEKRFPEAPCRVISIEQVHE